jgi:hypothetical protein
MDAMGDAMGAMGTVLVVYAKIEKSRENRPGGTPKVESSKKTVKKD